MRRIQTLIAKALAGQGPYARLSGSALTDVAGQCGPAEVADILAFLGELSAERDALPDWDGDSADDIARAAETLRAVLAHAAPALIPEIARGLDDADARVRAHTAMALAGHGRQAEALLRAQLARETDATARALMSMALDELAAR